MTNTRLPRLSRPGVLESIAPHRLASLLQPHSTFFEGKGVSIDASGPIDCQAAIRAVMEADRDTPAELLEAICLIDELANEPTVDLLLSRVTAAELGLETNGQHSAADILVAAWLNHREQLVQTQAQTRFKRARSFDYFQSIQSKPPKFTMPSDATICLLEQDIDSWFVERYRGRGTKVEIFENGFEVKISILHGSLFRRQPVVNAGVFGIQSFWPVQSDAAVYNRAFGELRINAKSLKEKALYCRLLGKHLFGDENCFPTGIKYTLGPLREHGFAALVSDDVEDVSNVRMVELCLGDPDERYGVITIRKGHDLFLWAQERSKDIQIERRLISATFKVSLVGRKADLAVTIRPPNVAIYNRGPAAAIIEELLTQRGFIIAGQSGRRARHEPALVSA